MSVAEAEPSNRVDGDVRGKEMVVELCVRGYGDEHDGRE